jgi:uncharacterized glyoxalase superfamily protein PhnB
MNPTFQPYLFFRGRCSEAVAYYKNVLGAEEVTLMRFKDSPEKPSAGQMPAGMDDRIMHATCASRAQSSWCRTACALVRPTSIAWRCR